MKYDFKAVEKKWQDKWSEGDLYHAPRLPRPGRKFYALSMFPYPSGAGLHLGHPLSYTPTDIIARKRMMEGFDVLNPMGWDAFGLPAENYAIKTGVHPRETTWKSIDNFRRQLKMLGFSFDWTREVNTADPAYYRWTQWLFLQLYKHGLAYKKKAPVNWCDTCKTVLANEQVIEGACERCKNQVVQKNMEQWFFKVTAYADRLLEDLSALDWPEKIKAMQTNWIGRSEGANVVFKGAAGNFEISVFTTRPDTLCGVSYVVLAPEHPLVGEIVAPEAAEQVREYQQAARAKTEIQRTSLEQEKTGVPLGVEVVNPLSGERVPVLVADYVLANYGTGAVMGVPAHDERDWAFAKKYHLPVRTVIVPASAEAPADRPAVDGAFTEPGVMVNSGEYDGLMSEDAKGRIADALAAKNAGGRTVTCRLRDWLVSRQRYWGAPIPIIYCEQCGEVPVPEEDLPVLLPDDVDFRPTGESPLARSESFHHVRCPECGGEARRESDTMDTFVDSSWYFLRYCSPHDGAAAFDKEAVAAWAPVDLYVGGAEHAVLHLLYARFVTKALNDQGLIQFDEPFRALRNQGLIMGEDGQKMSKSRGNVVNPDDVVAEFGADALRMYLMFMGELEEPRPWSTASIMGVRRFLDRLDSAVHDLVHHEGEPHPVPDELRRALNKTVKKVTADIEAFKFNTAIAAMMTLMNDWQKLGGGDEDFAGAFVRLAAPFAPHLAEDLWELLGHEESVFRAEWPGWDESLTVDTVVEVPVQVNGKIRDLLTVPADLDEAELKERALASEKVKADVGERRIIRVIVVPGKLVNVVVS